MKSRLNKGRRPEFFFWRQNEVREIDLLIAEQNLKAVEIKSSQTYKTKYSAQLDYFSKLAAPKPVEKYVVYAGDTLGSYCGAEYLKWDGLGEL